MVSFEYNKKEEFLKNYDLTNMRMNKDENSDNGRWQGHPDFLCCQ